MVTDIGRAVGAAGHKRLQNLRSTGPRRPFALVRNAFPVRMGNCMISCGSAGVSSYECRSYGPEIAKFAVNFAVGGELLSGDGFVSDCAHHHPVFPQRLKEARCQVAPFLRGYSRRSAGARGP